MLSRALKISFLIFQAFWFTFVLPGHTRGLVSYAKSDSKTPVIKSCCSQSAPAKPGEPTSEQKSKCAICFYSAGLSVAVTFDIQLPELGLLEVLPLSVPIVIEEQQHLLTYYACGPPAIFFVA